LAVRIPLAIAKQACLGEGDCVTLAFDQNGGIVLRPTRRKYELSELVVRITPGATVGCISFASCAVSGALFSTAFDVTNYDDVSKLFTVYRAGWQVAQITIQ